MAWSRVQDRRPGDPRGQEGHVYGVPWRQRRHFIGTPIICKAVQVSLRVQGGQGGQGGRPLSPRGQVGLLGDKMGSTGMFDVPSDDL